MESTPFHYRHGIFLANAILNPVLVVIAALAAVSIAGCDSNDDGSDDGVPWNPSDIHLYVLIEAADGLTAKVSVDFAKLGAGGPTPAGRTTC